MSGRTTYYGSGPAAGPDREPGGGSGSRLRGIDAARTVAVIGMVMVHFAPDALPLTAGGTLYGLSMGRASVLFALLAGVGVALLARSRSSTGEVRGQLLLRGALLLPLGLWLQGLDHGVLVILQYYALYFLLATLVLSLSDRWLLGLAGTMLALGPLTYVAGQIWYPEWYVGDAATFGYPAAAILHDLLLSGAYPLVTWCVPLLVGIWLGRRNLYATATRWWLTCGGLLIAGGAKLLSGGLQSAFGAAIVGIPQYPDNPGLINLLSDEPHSQMPLWMLGSVGSAAFALGAMLLLADLLSNASWPLVATGQLALSVYVGHVLLLAAAPLLFEPPTVTAAVVTVGIFTVLAMVLCTLWRAVLPRGPLEAALAAPWTAIQRTRILKRSS